MILHAIISVINWIKYYKVFLDFFSHLFHLHRPSETFVWLQRRSFSSRQSLWNKFTIILNLFFDTNNLANWSSLFTFSHCCPFVTHRYQLDQHSLDDFKCEFKKKRKKESAVNKIIRKKESMICGEFGYAFVASGVVSFCGYWAQTKIRWSTHQNPNIWRIE